MSSVFSKIIEGKIPSHKVAEDEHYFAFLDIGPIAKGHTLVVPKIEVDYIFDLEDDTLAGLFLFSKKVAKAIESVIPCNRIGMMVMGLEVPHAHVHLIPIKTIGDMNFSNPKLKLSNAEFAEIAQKIRAKI
ncbi:UNVERIFIED_CONTAM: hypothetical protein GTU68_007024 [Idotea baltica]|nr:hypothetical protein [Idotea baltica]